MSKAIKAGQGEYYLGLAGADDYYLSGSEPPGFWLGSGAKPLGLEGEVDKTHFRNLLRGFSPDGTRALVRNANAERRAGWDLTWSAPKSVSVAWSQADAATRERIEECLRQAVIAAVAYLEAVGGISRRGVDGHIHESARLVFAGFLHSTSRAQDPQIHIHAILLNVGIRRDGTTGTLEPRELYRHQMAAGALFRAELAHALESALGLRSRREGRSFELLGVDTDLMAFFSKRRAEIEAELARTGWQGAKAAEIANFATRQQKEFRPREELFAEWQRIGRDHHWTTKELSWLLNAKFPARDAATEQSSAAAEAVTKLTTHESHFSRRQIVQAMAECCQGRGLNAATALQLSHDLLRSPEIVPLSQFRGEPQFTTREILALERQIIARAASMVLRQTPCDGEPVQQAMKRHPMLSVEQRQALQHLCLTSGGLLLVQGMAGTGKSTLFAAAREAWHAQGRLVIGAALSGKAASGLSHATQIPCTTLHRLLSSLRDGSLSLHPRSVMVIDEASMIGTRQLAELVAACSRSGASLVLSGDPRQLQAIELGGVFAELCRRFESVSLTEIHRQREPWARKAVQDFAQGEAAAGMLPYQQRGLVSEATDRHEAINRLVQDWKSIPGESSQRIALSATIADVFDINRRIQAERHLHGELGSVPVQIGTNTFYEQDRVLFVRNLPGLKIWNGDLGVITKVDGHAVDVRLDDGRTVRLDRNGFRDLRHGYALTTHKAQGITVEDSLVLAGQSTTHREMTYVQASRSRGVTRWYVDGELSELLPQMARSREKHAASRLVAGPELELTINR